MKVRRRKETQFYLFIYSLFNDQVSSIEYTESLAGRLGNNEFGRMWKEAIVS